MPIDSALLASFEGPNQFESLKQAVETNPEDFNSWGELLTKLEDQVRYFPFSWLVGYWCNSSLFRHVFGTFPSLLWILEEGRLDNLTRLCLTLLPCSIVTMRSSGEVYKIWKLLNELRASGFVESKQLLIASYWFVYFWIDILGHVDLLYEFCFCIFDFRSSRLFPKSCFLRGYRSKEQ